MQVHRAAIFFNLIPKTLKGLRIPYHRLTRRSLHLGEHFTKGSSNEIELRTRVPIAGRKNLPSSNTAGFPKFLSGPRENYPLLVKAVNGQASTVEQWAKRSREVIDEAYREYDKSGSAVAILFRGLPVVNAEDFSRWGNNLGYEPYAYVGGITPRYETVENVAVGSLDSKEVNIEPHNEMSYSVNYPKIFTMSCFKKAPWGGETAICDIREVLPELDQSFVEKCERKSIRYWHYLPDGKSKDEGKTYQTWQMQFQTEDRSDVEAYLKRNKYEWEWEGRNLFYWNNLVPFISHPRSGERLWFNQIIACHYTFFVKNPDFEGMQLADRRKYPYHTTYGDGEEIEDALIDDYRRVTWEKAVTFEWKEGDILFLDQLIVQHSRFSFEGERSVGISLFTY